MENKSKLNTILLVIVIILLVVGLAYSFFNNSKQVGNEDISVNENQSIVMEGYIYRNDIASETMRGNLDIVLRDVPDMENNNGAFSMKIESANLRDTLINKYNQDNSQWIKVKVTGILRSVTLPMNGTGVESPYLAVDTLEIE
ncbi:MAG TPA: hypothetical protein VFQ59_00640 [Candidatus Paceibacterota bacterium]|nr:hypothetical protein [Candidatus Paceibacterota bacterium]